MCITTYIMYYTLHFDGTFCCSNDMTDIVNTKLSFLNWQELCEHLNWHDAEAILTMPSLNGFIYLTKQSYVIWLMTRFLLDHASPYIGVEKY